MPRGILIGIIVGALVVLCIIAGCIYKCKQKKKVDNITGVEILPTHENETDINASKRESVNNSNNNVK